MSLKLHVKLAPGETLNMPNGGKIVEAPCQLVFPDHEVTEVRPGVIQLTKKVVPALPLTERKP